MDFIPCKIIVELLGDLLIKLCWGNSKRFCNTVIVYCTWDPYICFYVFPTKCAFVMGVVERNCEAGKEWQWVPRAAGACIPLPHNSEISKLTVVSTGLANLNCKKVVMIWLHSILLLIILNMPLFFIKIATSSFFYITVMSRWLYHLTTLFLSLTKLLKKKLFHYQSP